MVVDEEGFVFSNVFVDVCNDISIDMLVMVFDECQEEEVGVSLMENIENLSGCGEILICIWMVMDVCGNISMVI